MRHPRYPSLYQINTRVWLTELAESLKRPATLDDLPDAEFDRLAKLGIDWVWLLSVWQTGPKSQQVSRSNPQWRQEFQATLPDLREEDIAGSGFAIAAYTVHQRLGGNAALARLRERLRRRGLKLMLDFVPNHLGIDHPWVDEHPDYFVQGTEHNLTTAPQNYTRVKRPPGDLIFAYGRDPYFPGWPDTLQLNYANPAVQDAMRGELIKIAGQCDGVRCDMAMLLLPEVFERTWDLRPLPFWPQAIAKVRQRVPEFLFLAEVYWDLEWTLQQQGFDYTYDKRLYDRLREGAAEPVRAHLQASLEYQNRLARFLENHDEPRAAATFDFDVHQAAAVISFLSPGLRFFHQGQLEGRTKRISPHLVRAPHEAIHAELRQFYHRLLAVLRLPVVRNGDWQLLTCASAWEGNPTESSYLVSGWQGAQGRIIVAAINYAAHQSQCLVRLPFPQLSGKTWRLEDQLRAASYEWNGDDLIDQGLFLDQGPWQASIYVLNPI